MKVLCVTRVKFNLTKALKFCIFASLLLHNQAVGAYKTKQTMKKETPPPITLWIEGQRKMQGISKQDMAESMGIDRNVYRRRLNDKNGFSELELQSGLKALGFAPEVRVILDKMKS